MKVQEVPVADKRRHLRAKLQEAKIELKKCQWKTKIEGIKDGDIILPEEAARYPVTLNDVNNVLEKKHKAAYFFKECYEKAPIIRLLDDWNIPTIVTDSGVSPDII